LDEEEPKDRSTQAVTRSRFWGEFHSLFGICCMNFVRMARSLVSSTVCFMAYRKKEERVRDE
jgi:hypothetical protein